MQRLESAKCSFCGSNTEVFEGLDGRICRQCLADALSFAMQNHKHPREPKKEGNK